MDEKKALNEQIKTLNVKALECFNAGEEKKALEILKECEKILIGSQTSVVSLTLNNLGFYYRMTKKPLIALSYL